MFPFYIKSIHSLTSLLYYGLILGVFFLKSAKIKILVKNKKTRDTIFLFIIITKRGNYGKKNSNNFREGWCRKNYHNGRTCAQV